MKTQLIRYILLFVGLPLLLWSLGEFHEDTALKESLSVLVIISFSLMIGQFFLSRSSKVFLKGIKMSKLTRLHKIIGYVFISIIMLHPFCIIFPRYFEAGIEPEDAFITMITTLNNTGILLGISAWVLMFIIGITSFFRDKLGMSHKAWRVFHGILSIVFIAVASLHMIDLGSHINTPFVVLIIAFVSVGIILLLKIYLLKPNKSC